jgi:hypothetical protein
VKEGVAAGEHGERRESFNIHIVNFSKLLKTSKLVQPNQREFFLG